jgi:UDP-N-acetylmuramate: L-alanyl-gamma-D-glutamyl-meso-diaminopimelate ligase
MIPPNPGARIHLIGVAGTAMGALAGLLQEAGYRVTGSDTEIYPPVSTLLEQLRVPVSSGFRASNLEPAPDLVVIGNALSRGNEEVEEVLDSKLPYASLPEVLRELFLRGRESIVVAGTHGKTTVTSILSWMFHSAGLDPGFLIGGLPLNFPRSFCRGSGRFFILEGDEYDTAFFDKGPKFLHYRPDAAVLTSVEFDHADIYRDLDAVETAFRRLVNLVPRRGFIAAYAEAETVRRCLERAFCQVETFGLKQGDWQARDIRCVSNPSGLSRAESRGDREGADTSQESITEFTVAYRGMELGSLRAKLFGDHNVLNLLAAVAIASRYEIPWKTIAEAAGTFQGVRRRMEVVGEAAGIAIVDDFAHHPTAIRETLRAARARFSGRRIWAILEPRSNTLVRKVFENELAEVLALADQVVLADVHRKGRLAETERLDPEKLVASLRANGVPARFYADAAAIVEALAPELRPGDVAVIMSNGGFGGIHGILLAALQSRDSVGALAKPQ